MRPFVSFGNWRRLKLGHLKRHFCEFDCIVWSKQFPQHWPSFPTDWLIRSSFDLIDSFVSSFKRFFFWRFWREFWRANGSRLNSSSLTLIYLMNWRQNKRVSIDDVDVVVKRCISCDCAHFKNGHWTPSLVCDVCATLGFCLDGFGDFSIALIRSFSAGRPSGTVRAASANKCHGNVIR